MASAKDITLAAFGLATLGVATLLTLTSGDITTLTSTTANVTTVNATDVVTAGTLTFSAEAGNSTGSILCLRSTGTVGKCSGNGTGSGTQVCSVCAAL